MEPIMWGKQQIIKPVLILLLLASATLACGQRKNTAPAPMMASAGNSASGTLTVTCIVATSVGVVTDENGESRIVIANAPDRADNVSQFVMLADLNSPAPARTRKTRKNNNNCSGCDLLTLCHPVYD